MVEAHIHLDKAFLTEAEILQAALTMGADLVGGCPYNDSDGLEHIRIVFGLAEAFGVDVDFHADFADEPEHVHVRAIVDATVRAGWHGRVVVGHVTEPAALPADAQDEIAASLAAAPQSAHLRALLSAITTHPAAMLRLRDYGLVPGCWAGLVVWECEQPEDVAASLPGRALVVKRGRVSVQSERRVVERRRAR